MVETQGELVRIGIDLGGGGVGARTKGTGRVVGHGIAGEDLGNASVHGDGERISGTVGISGNVSAGAFF